MPGGKKISKEEVNKVLDLKLKGKNLEDLSKILKRSLKVFIEFCVMATNGLVRKKTWSTKKYI